MKYKTLKQILNNTSQYSGITIKKLSKDLKLTTKTVYKYVNTLKAFGIITMIDKKDYKRDSDKTIKANTWVFNGGNIIVLTDQGVEVKNFFNNNKYLEGLLND